MSVEIGPRADGSESRGDLAATSAFARSIHASEPTVIGRLQRIIDVARAELDACEGASISLQSDGVFITPAWTDDLIVDIDTLQYENNEGPCVDAIRHGVPFHARDLRDDPRWPTFGPKAADRGMQSLLSFSLSTEDVRASLNLYAPEAGAYTADDLDKGMLLSSAASAALASTALLEKSQRDLAEAEKQLRQLQRALRHRADIDRALGVLMRDRNLDVGGAFTLLRHEAESRRVDLRAVAAHVAATGSLPGPTEDLLEARTVGVRNASPSEDAE